MGELGAAYGSLTCVAVWFAAVVGLVCSGRIVLWKLMVWIGLSAAYFTLVRANHGRADEHALLVLGLIPLLLPVLIGFQAWCEHRPTRPEATVERRPGVVLRQAAVGAAWTVGGIAVLWLQSPARAREFALIMTIAMLVVGAVVLWLRLVVKAQRLLAPMPAPRLALHHAMWLCVVFLFVVQLAIMVACAGG